MVAVMILAFLTAWIPYSVLSLLVAFGGIQISPAVSLIPALCAKSSICWNPIIYIGLNTQVNCIAILYYTHVFHHDISISLLHCIRLFCNVITTIQNSLKLIPVLQPSSATVIMRTQSIS
jgi:hypothetical protein